MAYSEGYRTPGRGWRSQWHGGSNLVVERLVVALEAGGSIPPFALRVGKTGRSSVLRPVSTFAARDGSAQRDRLVTRRALWEVHLLIVLAPPAFLLRTIRNVLGGPLPHTPQFMVQEVTGVVSPSCEDLRDVPAQKFV